MLRYALIACVVYLSGPFQAGTLRAEEPLNVALEFARITTEYGAKLQAGPRTSATFQKANAARIAALKKLVADAETAKSQEHVPLSQAYQLIGRHDDAVREARAVLAQSPKDLSAHSILVMSLGLTGKLDEAEKEFAAAHEALGDNPTISGMRSSLATAYQRQGNLEKAAEHLTAYLEELWPTVVRAPVTALNFQNQANMLANTAIQGKRAAEALATFDKLIERAAGEAKQKPQLSATVAALKTAKVRLLIAADRTDDARKLADEQADEAQKRLAAAPEDPQAALDVLAALRLKLLAAARGETAEEEFAAYQKFVDEQLDDHADSADFISAAGDSRNQAAQRLVSAGKIDEAEQLLKDWQARLDKLMSESAAAKAAVARAKQQSQLLIGRLATERKRAALLGKAYFPIQGATWLNGSPLKPEELRGKVVLLDFWAVWCGPCVATFPHLREWHEKYAEKGLVIIGVTNRYSFDWDAETKKIKQADDLAPEKEDAATTAFVKHHELKHVIAVMPDKALSADYVVTGIPQAVVIDKQGIVRLIRVGSGPQNAEQLERTIRQALDLPANLPAVE